MQLHYLVFIISKYLSLRGKKELFSLDSIISITGIIIGVIALTISLSLFSGYQKIIKDIILGVNSHIYIFKFSNLQITQQEYQKLEKYLYSQQEIEAVSPFIYTEAMISHSDKIAGIILRGVYPELEKNTTSFAKFISQGKINIEDNQAIIGEKLAQRIQSNVGDTIKLIIPISAKLSPVGMIPKTKKVLVSGIYSSGMYEYDNSYVYLNMHTSQDFIGVDNTYTGIAVKLRTEHLDDTIIISERIKKYLPFEFRLTNWIELNGNLFALLTLEKWVLYIILSFIILVAAFGMVSSLIMHIVEKRKEIGILKSFGVANHKIKSIFIVKSYILGLIGIILGLLLGYIGSQILGNSRIISLDSDVYFIDHLVVENNPYNYMLIFATAVIIIVIASLIPLRKISKLNPVDIITNR
ncbi:MAG: hypothetical protein DRH57_02405 [Candidatus Cloacimonadota bacterium]|nr:MAG: hypothetical protein DRH57_02405 [Candidatus Cloacimonadota bacterium]